jgi:hypothetical protein
MSKGSSRRRGLKNNGRSKSVPLEPLKDWKRTVGMFTDDEGMQQLFKQALRIRAQDRRQTRGRSNNKRKANS